MKNLTIAANIIAEHFEAEKANFEKSSTDYIKAAYQRRAQMLLDALTLISCINEPVFSVNHDATKGHETDN